ncbi:MAG: HAAS signaling domain-containing protein [Candidatus Heimdallarchaeota archaeon]
MSKNKNNLEHLSEDQKLIREFLDEVERKLPFWLKDEKKNVDDILEELETHIWDRANELADGEDPSIEDIKQVIDQMGTPSKIAGEYKRRGKPKFFITEELWTGYTKVIYIVAGVLLGINLLVMFTRIPSAVNASISVGELFSSWISGSMMSVAIALVLITVLFIYLSHEGYLPEDFDRLGKRFVIYIPFDRFRTDKTRKEDAPITPVSEKQAEKVVYTEQVVESKVVKERPVRAVKEPTPRMGKRHKHLGKDYLTEGIMGIAFGVVAIILPFMPFLDFLPYQLKIWFALTGVTGLVLGFIRFFQALVGRRIGLQQALLFLGLAPQGVNIALYHAILYRREIAYDWVFGFVQSYITADTYQTIATVVVWVIIGGTILKMLSDFMRIIRLGFDGFPQK